MFKQDTCLPSMPELGQKLIFLTNCSPRALKAGFEIKYLVIENKFRISFASNL